jgi:L-asparaginase
MTKKVMLINTGGTIGMVPSIDGDPLSPLRPAENWKEITGLHPVLSESQLGISMGYHQFKPLLDSSQMRYENWAQMAEVIAQHYANYDGFVLLHGTDTMCYTASALSFMLENLGKPVILTGSQIPLVKPRSDAVQNLITSLVLATMPIPEVCVFFRDQLIRGNRSRKLSASGYSAFGSPNYPPLATAGEHVVVNDKFIRKVPAADQGFLPSVAMDTRVMIVELFPGLDPGVLRNLGQKGPAGDEGIHGLVLKAYGTGTAPTDPSFLEAVQLLTEGGCVVVDVSQCPEGTVELGLYETSASLLNRGVVSGLDMTPEAAVSKLMYLLAKGWSAQEVKRVMQLNQTGEQSYNIHVLEFPGTVEPVPVHSASASVPGDVNLGELTGCTLRVRGVRFAEVQEAPAGQVELRVFLNHPTANRETPWTDARLACQIQTTALPATGQALDLFGDLTAPARRLVKPGQILTLTVVCVTGKLSAQQLVVSLHERTG